MLYILELVLCFPSQVNRFEFGEKKKQKKKLEAAISCRIWTQVK